MTGRKSWIGRNNMEKKPKTVRQRAEIKKGKIMAKKKLKYVLVRTYSAGVFAGELVSREGQEVVLKKARRIWYWSGAASLSELAQRGTSDPDNCKFPCEVDRIELLQAVEIIDISPMARKSIGKVPVWTR